MLFDAAISCVALTARTPQQGLQCAVGRVIRLSRLLLLESFLTDSLISEFLLPFPLASGVLDAFSI